MVCRRLRILLLYLGVALAALGPVALRPGTSLVGYPNIDGLDTVVLRGAVADLLASPAGLVGWIQGGTSRSTAAFYPVGFDLLALTPNVVDHLVAAPLVHLLPFPWSDNAWWLLVLVLNGLAGHALGRRLGGSDAAGLLGGLGWMLSEAALREANLHHAPQALLVFPPLFLVALVDALEGGGRRAWMRAGLHFALASLVYWYVGLFLAVAGILAFGLGHAGRDRWPWPGLGRFVRDTLPAGLVVGLVLVAFLGPWLWGWTASALTRMTGPPGLNQAAPALEVLDPDERFLALHGGDVLFPFRSVPLDRSNRVSLVLVVAAFLGARRMSPPARRALLGIAVAGGILVLGPVLKVGERPVMVGGQPVSLPFGWVGDLHPWLGRLFWPERWGLLVPLGLLGLAARTPRPGVLATLLVVETWLLSGNLPLEKHDLHGLQGWSHLSRTRGAVLELPLRRPAMDAAVPGMHRRYHGRDMVNPLILPPGCPLPAGWQAWLESRALVQAIRLLDTGRWPETTGTLLVDDLRESGVTVVALDAEPDGAFLTEGSLQRYRTFLTANLGPPQDYGILLAWWLDPDEVAPPGIADGEAFRADLAAWKAGHPPVLPDTLIKPSWWLRQAVLPAVERTGP